MKDERSTLQQESTELLVHVLSCVCSCVSRSPGLHVQYIVSLGITQRGAKIMTTYLLRRTDAGVIDVSLKP